MFRKVLGLLFFRDTLEKPAQTIYRHDLVGVLESAIRDCNSSYDSKLLSRLDVCLLEVRLLVFFISYNFFYSRKVN